MNFLWMIGDNMVEYVLKRSHRARRIRISVHMGGEVTVTIPTRADETLARQFIDLKSEWIIAKVELMKKKKPLAGSGGNRREFCQFQARAKKLVMQKIRDINSVYGFVFGRVSIRFQKTRWGSCSRAGNLNFNYRIIFLPDHLANYLIAHELSHLKEMNHGVNFWKLVEKSVPNCKVLARELKGVV